MSGPSTLPPADVDITPTLIHDLLSDQHPDLAGLPLGSRHVSWDNVTTRLGDHLAVRMPRIIAAVPLLEREITWLPIVSTGWTFDAPVPVVTGSPGHGYPWRWSVVPWFEGSDAMETRLTGAGVAEFGRALRQVHITAPEGSPHTPYRTTPLREREGEALDRIDAIDAKAGPLDLEWASDAARKLWAEASALPWPAPSWVHADLHPGNVITRDGHLAAIIDWGEAGAGDPALDLGQLWLFFDPSDVERALAAYGDVDDDLLLRIQGECLANALRLVCGNYPPFMALGWKALTGLGLAQGAGPASA